MKKLLSFIIIAILCLSVFTGCEVVDTVKGWLGMGEPETPTNITYDLDGAAEYVHSDHMNKVNEITAADYTVPAQVYIAGVKYTVDWTVDNELVKVTKGKDKNGNDIWNVDVVDEAEADHTYKLTATITAGDGTKKTVSFEHTVLAFAVTSWEDYMQAKKDENVVVEGIVVAISSKSTGAKRNHLFLMDKTGVGGYYNYDMAEDPITDLGIEVGMTVRVTGPCSPYNGMQEIYKGAAKIINREKATVTPVDITEKFVEGANFNNFVALPVVINNVVLGGQSMDDPNHQYLYFTVNGVQSYVRTYVTDFPSTLVEADKATIDALHASKQGYEADVTGILVTFSGAPYIIPTSVDCFYDINLPERTDAEKIALELGGISVLPTDVTNATDITLPLVGTTYDAVKFSWVCDDTTVVIGADGKVTLTPGANAKVLKFTVTATIGEGENAVTDTKEFTVNIAASFVMSETLAYVPYINIGTYGAPLYLDGGVNGRYLTTTTDPSSAAKVYAEKADGGYKLYILVDGVKNYITMYLNSDNKDSVKYDPMGTTIYTYNSSVNAFVANFNNVDKYLGTYLDKNSKPYTTISVSSLSYLTAENSGVSNFPLELLPVAVGTELQGSFTQVSPEEKTLYLNGGVDGRYLTTTELLSEAVKVYAEKVEGGYKFYILVEDVKNYITIYSNSDNKDSVKYDPNGNTIFTYKSDVNAWATNFNGVDKYLGSYYSSKNNSTFSTVSVSNLSYIDSENTGVTQYPLTYSIPAHVCSFADATCTAPATCSCGKTQGDPIAHTYAEATCVAPKTCECGAVEEGSTANGHTIVAGSCTACEYQVVTIAQALELADNAGVIVKGVVTSIAGAWSDQYGNMNVYIADETGSLYAYRLYTKVAVNDIITVTGKMGTYDGRQVAYGTATINGTHEHTWGTDDKCFCGASKPVAGETTVTAKHTLTTTGNLTEGNATTNATVLGLDSAIFTVNVGKGGSSSVIGLNKDGTTRLYANKADGNGSELTISVAEGYTIKSIKITYAGTNGGCSVTVNGSAIATDKATSTSVSHDINASSFMLKNVSTPDNVQVHIQSIEIVYAAN